MKNRTLFIITLGLACLNAMHTLAQQRLATNKVQYMITFEKESNTFTAWVVPEYDTPNFNNPDAEEKGVTAQFSIQVPKDFSLSNFKSIKGSWEGYNSKIGAEKEFIDAGLNTNLEYIIIGKAPAETNYGKFENGKPVALFAFQGQTKNPELVDVVGNDDPFVKIAYNDLSLNVAPSFYSRSGQKMEATATPLEQFQKKTSLRNVIDKQAQKLGAEATQLITDDSEILAHILAYPNPTDTVLNLTFFSQNEGQQAAAKLIDQNGKTVLLKEKTTTRGFNTITADIKQLNAGLYIANVNIEQRTLTTKVIKK